MAEQLTGYQLLGQGRTVDHDERFRAALAVTMDLLREDFLAGACLALNHDG